MSCLLDLLPFKVSVKSLLPLCVTALHTPLLTARNGLVHTPLRTFKPKKSNLIYHKVSALTVHFYIETILYLASVIGFMVL